MIADYAGTVLLVSHDRDFLDRTATGILAAEGSGRWIEYAGGYSDMLMQRAGREKAEPPKPESPRRPAERRTAETTPRSGSPKRKLSFHEKHALETLPNRIGALQAEVRRLSHRLADADLFRADPTAFEKTASELNKAEADLAAAEDEWLRLELLRESVEG
jgi:ATP-binding cassette subfamily F protein uup